MPRIPDDELDRLKAEISLVRLVEGRGIALARQGKDWVGRCPFHADETPSLVVTPSKNLFHCFGCGAAGGPVDWVMKFDGVSFRHAVELLRAAQGCASVAGGRMPGATNDLPVLAAAVDGEPQAVKRSTVAKLASPLASDADDQTALGQVVDYYHGTLLASPDALAYLEKRGLHHAELIERFRLGFANRSLAYRLPQKNRAAGAAVRGRLQALGVLRESGHEHLNGSIVVPLFDAAGDVVQLYGRKVHDNLRQGTSYHLYLPGPQRGVWNLEGLRGCEDAIVCEALFDAMTFWVHGFRNVTSTYGAGGVTDELLDALMACGVRRVFIAFDRDAAGDAGAEKLGALLVERGIEVLRVRFPKGMDANEYALQVTPASKSLAMALKTAEWVSKGVRTDDADAAETAPLPSFPRTREPSVVDPVQVETTDAAGDVEPSPASSLAAASDIEAEVTDAEITLRLGTRQYRVRGLSKATSLEVMKVNVLVREAAGFHVDTFDLYSAKARAGFVAQASREIGVSESVLKSDLGALLLKLEELQDQLLRGVLAKKEQTPVMSDAELQSALAWLRSPHLLDRVLDDFALCGVVGEEANKQVAYLAAVSRLLPRPLAVLVQSSSAAGKSSLMEAVLRLMPAEQRIQYSAMTGQSLFYLGEQNLKHKILAISEEEGASQASYALKLLQSEGEVSIASTGKNAVTGNLETQTYRVEGPVMLFSTTTAIDLDEELLNRCLVLSVDESREQTQAIHAAQRSRRTLAGLRAGVARDEVVALHQNAQRLLRPLAVVNPYAERLTFLSEKTRMRRDHEKYLALIDAIALLHQYQREVKREVCGAAVVEYIEVELADIAQANALAHAVLGRTLDELPPQTRKLLNLVSALVREACVRERCTQADVRFTRKTVRDATGWSETQLRVHLERLTQMEYLVTHRGTRGQSFVYELLWDGAGEDAGARLPGLIEVETLQSAGTTTSSRGAEGEFAGSTRPQNGANAGGSRGGKAKKNADKNSAIVDPVDVLSKNAPPVNGAGKHRSRTHAGASLLAAASASTSEH
jgi:DNA primase